MSEPQALNLNELAAMTVADFRKMETAELIGLAKRVREAFPNMPNLGQFNPAYGEVMNEIDKKEKDVIEDKLTDLGTQAYGVLQSSALADIYKGVRIEVRETEDGKLLVKKSYLTSEVVKRKSTKATSSSSKVLDV